MEGNTGVATADGAGGSANQVRVKEFLLKYSFAIVFVLLVVYLSFATSKFLTVSNIVNVFRQVSNQGIIAVGMTMILIMGQIDLSVGALVAFAAAGGLVALADQLQVDRQIAALGPARRLGDQQPPAGVLGRPCPPQRPGVGLIPEQPDRLRRPGRGFPGGLTTGIELRDQHEHDAPLCPVTVRSLFGHWPTTARVERWGVRSTRICRGIRNRSSSRCDTTPTTRPPARNSSMVAITRSSASGSRLPKPSSMTSV